MRLHSGSRQMRLEKLILLERVSARDLNPEIKMSQTTFRTPIVCPILGWGKFLIIQCLCGRHAVSLCGRHTGQVCAGGRRRCANILEPHPAHHPLTHTLLISLPCAAGGLIQSHCVALSLLFPSHCMASSGLFPSHCVAVLGSFPSHCVAISGLIPSHCVAVSGLIPSHCVALLCGHTEIIPQ